MIKNTNDEGYKYFDFGPLGYKGQYQFKIKWGIQLIDYFQYSNSPIKEQPIYFRTVFASFWKYGIPTNLSKHIGHFFRKWLAF